MIVGLLICLSLAAVALAIAVYRSLHRYDDVPDFPTSTSGTWEPFYGCSNNAPWYIAAVEVNRRLEEWWAYYLDEIGRRGREFPFPLVLPDSNAAELWANTTTDTDESLIESPFAQATRLKEARERARVHGWDKLERPVSIIEA